MRKLPSKHKQIG